jgi:SHS2 domain-containing protein
VPDSTGRYELIDHTGDIAILVRAPTLPSLYDTAARALFDVILDVATVEPKLRCPVSIGDAADAEDLLVRFLSELLFLHDARGWLFAGFDTSAIASTRIEGEALGEMFDPVRHAVRRQVKAVTYHYLLLSQDAEGWSARLVLDL